MIKLTQHIAYLLLTCRRVTVPGLGTFHTSYERAFFDAAEGVFYPGKIRIVFNPKWGEDNFLLETSLKRQLKIRDTEAEKMIDDFVSNIRVMLNKNQYCRLDGIGYLMKDSNNSLCLKDTFWKRHRYPTLSPMLV